MSVVNGVVNGETTSSPGAAARDSTQHAEYEQHLFRLYANVFTRVHRALVAGSDASEGGCCAYGHQ